MSRETVEAVIGKAVSDRKFREALFANPDQALAGYGLTDDELAALKAIDAETMEAMAGGLDDRISKAFIAGWTSGGVYTHRVSGGATRIGGPMEGW
jgi:hypothetical protein